MSTTAQLEIVSVERIDGTEAIIEFSDGTCLELTAEELIAYAKTRKPIAEREAGN